MKSVKIIVGASIFLNFIFVVGIHGGLFGIPKAEQGKFYWKQVYQKTYMRLSPYIFGMVAALKY